jgi:DNA-binding CsgD family transcriptional regulator
MSPTAGLAFSKDVRLELSFFDATPYAIACIREDGLLVYQNNAAIKLWTPDAGPPPVVGINILDWGPPGFAHERLMFMRQLVREGRDGVVRDMWRGEQIITQLRLMPHVAGQTLRYFLTVHIPRVGPIDLSEFQGRAFLEPKIQHLGPLAELSPREMEVLALVGEGLTAAEISKRMHRSVDTVNTHKASLLRKLGCKNSTQLATIAQHSGLKFDENADVVGD